MQQLRWRLAAGTDRCTAQLSSGREQQLPVSPGAAVPWPRRLLRACSQPEAPCGCLLSTRWSCCACCAGLFLAIPVLGQVEKVLPRVSCHSIQQPASQPASKLALQPVFSDQQPGIWRWGAGDAAECPALPCAQPHAAARCALLAARRSVTVYCSCQLPGACPALPCCRLLDVCPRAAPLPLPAGCPPARGPLASHSPEAACCHCPLACSAPSLCREP